MNRRVVYLLRARLAAGPKGGLPVAALLLQALVASVFCGLVRDGLPPFAYGLFALSLSTALVGLPLLGELGGLLRREEAADWVGALPLTPRDLRLARTAHLVLVLAALVLAALVPAALLAPSITEPLARVALPFLGLGLALLFAAFLLGLQGLLGGRAESLLLLLQTALVLGIVCGLILGLRYVPTLARVPTLGDDYASFLWFFPPAWFAAPLAGAEGEAPRWWLPAVATLVALLGLRFLPEVEAPVRGGRPGWLVLLLAPLRRLVTRVWVRQDERGAFDLVYDALPREREVVLRTYPMVGIPLAFLAAAASSEGAGDPGRVNLLALLLFTAGIYLPILLTQVPSSESPAAAWILSSSPASPGAIANGAVKALFLRFLVPLYAVLGFLALTLVGFEPVLWLIPPALVLTLVVLRALYPLCVTAAPLSQSPDEVRADLDWMGTLGVLAMGLAVVAFLARRYLEGAGPALVATLALVGLSELQARALRRRVDHSLGGVESSARD